MEEARTAIDLLAGPLQFISVAAWGMLVGSMLTEGMILVPYWRSLSPTEFFSWYAANDRRLLAFFAPLTSIAALSTVAAAGVSLWIARPGRWYALVAAILSAVVVSMFPLYFQRANARFSAAGIPAGDLAAELARWAAWHRVRSGLGVVALTAALLGMSIG